MWVNNINCDTVHNLSKFYQNLHQEDALKQTEGLQNIATYHDVRLGKTFADSEMMVRLGKQVNLVICQKSKIKGRNV